MTDKPTSYNEVMMLPFKYKELENQIYSTLKQCEATFNGVMGLNLRAGMAHEAYQTYGCTEIFDHYEKLKARKICVVRVIDGGKIELELSNKDKELVELANLDKRILEVLSEYVLEFY